MPSNWHRDPKTNENHPLESSYLRFGWGVKVGVGIKRKTYLGGGNSKIFYFQPSWFNHQLATNVYPIDAKKNASHLGETNSQFAAEHRHFLTPKVEADKRLPVPPTWNSCSFHPPKPYVFFTWRDFQGTPTASLYLQASTMFFLKNARF